MEVVLDGPSWACLLASLQAGGWDRARRSVEVVAMAEFHDEQGDKTQSCQLL
jgi:hypothetical protein